MDNVRVIVASEFDPYPEVIRQLEYVSAQPGTAICLAIRKSESQSPELASLLNAAAEKGVPIIGWLLLDEAEGYWYNEDNFTSARTQTLAFVDWIESNGLPLEWLMFDMEMHLEKTRVLEESEDVGSVLNTVVTLLKSNLDAEQFIQRTADYAGLVDELHGRGYKVTAAAYPFVLDDMEDGDTDIQDSWDTPIQGVDWDEIYFMVYRTTFESLLGILPGPDIVYQYGKLGREYFGDKAVMGLGIIAGVGMVSDAGYDHPAPLADDIAAARSAGNDRVFIFSLDGMVKTGEPENWLKLIDTPAKQPEPDGLTEEIRGIFTLLDVMLETE